MFPSQRLLSPRLSLLLISSLTSSRQHNTHTAMSEHTPLPELLFPQAHKPDHLRGQYGHKVQQLGLGMGNEGVLSLVLAILLLDAS